MSIPRVEYSTRLPRFTPEQLRLINQWENPSPKKGEEEWLERPSETFKVRALYEANNSLEET